MWLITLDGNSRVVRFGRAFFTTSQSTRSIVPGNSEPRSYLPVMNAAMREALSSSTKASIRSMLGRPWTK